MYARYKKNEKKHLKTGCFRVLGVQINTTGDETSYNRLLGAAQHVLGLMEY